MTLEKFGSPVMKKMISSDSVQFPLLFTHVFHFMFQFIFGLRAEKRSWTVAQEEEKDKGKFRKRRKGMHSTEIRRDFCEQS